MSGKRLVGIYVLTALFCSLVGMGFALRISPAYTTDALIIPKEQSNNSSQLSGLATATKLLGLGSGVDQNSNFAKFQKYWASRDVAARLLKKYPKLERELFRANWDFARNTWYDRPHTFSQYIATPLNWLFGVYPSYVPTAQNFADYIKNAVKLEVSPATGDAHLTFSSSDAKFAQWFLRTVISETDGTVRDAEQRRDRDFIDFSRRRLERETNVAYRDALTDSVRQFEISNIYSEAGDNFSFQYVEEPDLPITHSAPRPLLYAVLIFVFANLVSLGVISLMLLWPESRLARSLDSLYGRLFQLLLGWFSRDHSKAARRTT